MFAELMPRGIHILQVSNGLHLSHPLAWLVLEIQLLSSGIQHRSQNGSALNSPAMR